MTIKITKEKRANAEVSLTGILPAATITPFWAKALANAQKELALPGFRKGHVPEERIIQEYGEKALWKDAAESAMHEEVEAIMKQEEVFPIMPLSLSLSAGEKDADVPFEITAVVAPTCELGDYKKLAEDAISKLPQEDTEKEHAEAIKAFRTQARGIAKMQSGQAPEEGDTEKIAALADTALSDEEAKGLGFENGKAFEHFVEGEAQKAVTDRALQKKRGAIAEALLTASTCDIPKSFIADEAKALLEGTKKDVAHRGMTWNDYLKHAKKTEEEILKDMHDPAEKRISLDIMFGAIVKKEELKPNEGEKEREDELVKKLVEQQVPEDKARMYIREQLLREQVWEILGAKAATAA